MFIAVIQLNEIKPATYTIAQKKIIEQVFFFFKCYLIKKQTQFCSASIVWYEKYNIEKKRETIKFLWKVW